MAIAFEQDIFEEAASGNLTMPSWTPQANELVLIAVTMGDETDSVSSISGNGLTFVKIDDDTNAFRRIEVWRAMSSSAPTTGQITVTMTSGSDDISAVAYRMSGVDTSGSNGSGAVEVAVASGNSTSNNDMKDTITTLSDNAVVVGNGFPSTRTFTPPSGETAVNINSSGQGGPNGTNTCVWYETTTTAGSVTIGDNNDMSGSSTWAMISLSIKEAVEATGVKSSINLLGVGI